jgi:hypothetical protein
MYNIYVMFRAGRLTMRALNMLSAQPLHQKSMSGSASGGIQISYINRESISTQHPY